MHVPLGSGVADVQDDLDDHGFAGGDEQLIELKVVTFKNVRRFGVTAGELVARVGEE
jgi:hypothetical protein